MGILLIGRILKMIGLYERRDTSACFFAGRRVLIKAFQMHSGRHVTPRELTDLMRLRADGIQNRGQ